MSFCRARKLSLLPARVDASKRLRMMRRPTSMCAGAASSSLKPRASLKALILSASSPLPAFYKYVMIKGEGGHCG